MASGRLTMVLLASLPSAFAASQLGFAASPGRLSLGRAASGVSASLHAARSSPRPARLGMGGARMMSASPETEKAEKTEKDSGVVLNPDFTFKMDDIVSVCKRRGFVFQSSEIYNGFNGFYDYGPLGVELKNNIKKIWWRDMVTARPSLSPIQSHPSIQARPPPRVERQGMVLHPGGNPGANPKSISHRCHPILVAFVRELTKETTHLPLGCLQGGDVCCAGGRCTGARTWSGSTPRSSRRPRSGSRPGTSKASLTPWSTARCRASHPSSIHENVQGHLAHQKHPTP